MRKNEVTIERSLCFFAGSCAHFQSFGVHSSMNEKSAIEKLHQITREKEA
jgi:hypothetical protein